ncbi:MAG: HRDC domain-containing protein, partial [Pseudomonadota bacterium]|nr:HRDC domain-containing protein [Pseudomonadota bacterium]
FQFDHHHLGVYGKGKDYDNNAWRSVFRQLVARGYLSVDLDGYGGLKLEERCRALLRGEESIALRRDEKLKAARKSGRTSSAPLAGDIDLTLFEALRACRQKLAEEQKVPPYVIFHNTTLEDMCRIRPRTLDEFALVSGVGERKKEKYGPAFLAALTQVLPD